MRFLLFFLYCLFISTTAMAGDTTTAGGIADIQIPKHNKQLPEVRFGLHEPVIIEQAQSWRILIGIGLDTLPGQYIVFIKPSEEDSEPFSRLIKVTQSPNYLLQTVSNDDSPVLIEHKQVSEIDFSNTQQPELPLKLPIDGSPAEQWQNQFGYKQNKDQQVRARNFISIESSDTQVVLAPQNAIVSQVVAFKDDTFSVFLDHGRGLYSIISGVSDVTVEAGNGIISGAVIGKLTKPVPPPEGTQDKTTPPLKARLIWQCLINGAYVNPLLLTQID